jgi:hypothetical protein
MQRLAVGSHMKSRVFIFVAALSAHAEVYAQKLGHGTDPTVSIWQVLGALIISVVLALAGALALQKRMNGSHAPALAELASLIGRRRTTPRKRRLALVESLRVGSQLICILRCDESEHLIAIGAHGARKLANLPFGGRDSNGSGDS